MSAPATVALGEAFTRCCQMDASLDQRLAAFSSAVRELIPAYAHAVDHLVTRLAEAGAGMSAPAVGEPMPPFILPDENGRLLSLEALLDRGPVAITFHRGHWCPWCRISARALAQAHGDIAGAGGQVVAIMPERQKFAAEFKADARSPFTVLTDMDNGYALSLNLAIWIGPDLERLLSSFGRALPEYQGNNAWTLPIPATFVIDQEGRVSARFVDPDFRQRVAVDRLLDAIKSAR